MNLSTDPIRTCHMSASSFVNCSNYLIASTYFHIYRFLKSRSLDTAAKALKKAVKDVVVLRDDVPAEEPLLNDIIVEWKELVEAKAYVS